MEEKAQTKRNKQNKLIMGERTKTENKRTSRLNKKNDKE